MSAQDSTQPSSRYHEDRMLVAVRVLILAIGAGLVFVAFNAIQAWSLIRFVSVSSVGIMVAGSSLLGGGFLGFLFGIPRTVQQNYPAVPPDGTERENRLEAGADRVRYGANTNLEQISDWLTKILVGIGLTQISQIPEALQQLSAYIGDGMGGLAGSNVFALATFLYFSICGFLLGFLWTRLYLAGAFTHTDLSLRELAQRTEEVASKVAEIDKQQQQQQQLDALALSLVQRHLNPSNETPAVSLEKLAGAIKDASPVAKVTIFNQAHIVRGQNWRKDKEKVKLTIPIFRALVDSDPEHFHRNHGQLGYALKDQDPPDWAAAEAELTKAIEIRGDWREHGWLFYEFNRAFCRIMQDPAFRSGQAASPNVRVQIIDDLRAAIRDDYIRRIIVDDPDIRRWMDQNQITLTDL